MPFGPDNPGHDFTSEDRERGGKTRALAFHAGQQALADLQAGLLVRLPDGEVPSNLALCAPDLSRVQVPWLGIHTSSPSPRWHPICPTCPGCWEPDAGYHDMLRSMARMPAKARARLLAGWHDTHASAGMAGDASTRGMDEAERAREGGQVAGEGGEAGRGGLGPEPN